MNDSKERGSSVGHSAEGPEVSEAILDPPAQIEAAV